jgi:hypothetical protein
MTDFDKIWDIIVKGTVACQVCGEAGDTNEICPLSSPNAEGELRTMGNCDRRRNSVVNRPSHMVRANRRRKKERGG